MSVFDRFLGYFTLGTDVNKVDQDKAVEGVVSPLTPELNLETDDKDLIKLKKRWIKDWDGHAEKLNKRRKTIEKYWMGQHPQDFITQIEELDLEHPLVDNLIFESLETFLPQATRKNAEPIVSADNTEEGNELSDKVRKMLIHLADVLNMRLKIKSATRNWALYFLGVAKVGWDFEEDEISLGILRPHKFIMEPTATITEGGKYTGSYIGEIRKDTAEVLIERFPNKEKFIKGQVQDKLGTTLQYIEWWADNGRILFWTLKDEVLKKVRNPHWNYQEERTTMDEFGQETIESFTPLNHFKQPQYPYAFLSVFNLGMRPYDDTSLIEQNLGNQDLVTKRYRQIDLNVDGMNGGWAISGELSGITKEQSRAAIDAFREGRGVWIPQGSVRDAVQSINQSSLPADVFNNLQDARNELRGIFGTAGSTPQGTAEEKTVRGKILRAQQDQTRIGGGVAEYIEQFADRIFNLFVQMMYVYYDQEHIGAIIGQANAQETVRLRAEDLNRQLLVSVKEGSMIPKDPLTQANQAIDLFAAGAIDPVELHTRLDDPNPRETVKRLVEFQANPAAVVGDATMNSPNPLMADAPQIQSRDLLNNLPIQ